MNHKLSVSIGVLVTCVVALFFINRYPVLLSVVLLVLGYIKHRIYPIKKELMWYLLVCFVGLFVEILLVNYAHAWSYTRPQFMGVPAYMPLFWGTIGTTIIVAYDGFMDN